MNLLCTIIYKLTSVGSLVLHLYCAKTATARAWLLLPQNCVFARGEREESCVTEAMNAVV